jgi:hypothetical protein
VEPKKTKKVAGVDLGPDQFAIVGDKQNTATWLLPLEIPGNEEKTISVLTGMLGNWKKLRIPDELREEAWHLLRGACLTRGIAVPRQTTVTTVTKPVQTEEQQPNLSDADLKKIEAMADFHADSFLKALGLE